MFKHKSTKSTIFTLVAVLMIAVVAFSACDGTAFKPVSMPQQGEVSSNGGNAVRYGEWLYYVNGYQSSASAENTYTDIKARVGAISRIKIADLESLFAVYDDSAFTSSSARTKEIARLVEEKAQIVVPNYYYSGNTTTTQVNGIYIFDDRLYILTPNDELTAGGNSQTDQSVLTSFKLDGSDPVRHFVFTKNAAQILLGKVSDKLVATYIMDAEVGCIDVKAGTKITFVEKTTGAKLDVAGSAVVYLDEDGSICKLNAGASEAKVLVENKKPEGSETSNITYSIVSANAGYVYYTKADSTNSSVDNTCVYYATETVKDGVALKTTAPSSNYYGYKETIVYATSQNVQGTTLYGIYVLGDNTGSTKKQIVDPVQNDTSITFNRIEGDILYYTSDSVAYMVDLSAETPVPTAIGKSLASASGWSVPDIVGEYVITLGTGSVSAVKFNSETKENSSSVTLTIVEPAEEEEK